MSTTICVVTDALLESIAKWQDAIDAEGFSLHLSDGGPDQNLNAKLGEVETTIEYGVYDFDELKEVYGNVNFGRDWKHVVAFTFSSSFDEAIASWMAATAYARATGALIFDGQEGRLFSPDEALRITRDFEQGRPEMEGAIRELKQSFQRGTDQK